MEAWKGDLEGASKMKGHLEALLELIFLPKTFKFWSRGSYRGPHRSCSYK
jgi:hypothetical protein